MPTSEFSVDRVTEAVLADEPTAAAAIADALDAGLGLSLQSLEQSWWPDVDVLWLAIGGGGRAFVRYLAQRGDSLRLLTGRPDTFNALAAGAEPARSEVEVLEYALFYLEVTRSMAVPSAVLEWGAEELLPRWAAALEAVTGSAEHQLERIGRFARLVAASVDGPVSLDAVQRVISAVGGAQDTDGPVFEHLRDGGWSEDDLDRLSLARRLPPQTLAADECRLLARAHRALPPHGPARAYRRIDALTDVIGGIFEDERIAGIERDSDSGEIQRLNAPAGLYVSLPIAVLEPVSTPPYVWHQPGFTLHGSGAGGRSDWRYQGPGGGAAPLTEGAEIYAVDTFGGVALTHRWADGGWAVAAVSDDDDEPELPGQVWAQEAFVHAVLRGGGLGRPAARVSTSGAHFGVADVLLGVGQTVEIVRLQVSAEGAVHTRRVRII